MVLCEQQIRLVLPVAVCTLLIFEMFFIDNVNFSQNGGLGIINSTLAAEFESMLCYDPAGRRLELSSPQKTILDTDKPALDPIYISGGGSKYEYITRHNYKVNIVSTPVVVMDSKMSGANLYHNSEHLLPLFTYNALPDNFEWPNDNQAVNIIYTEIHDEMNFETLPFYAKVALGGGVEINMGHLSQYQSGPKNTAVCFNNFKLQDRINPFFGMTDNGQCSHAYFREIAYKSCGIVAPSAPPKTVTIYQRNKSRQLMDPNTLVYTIQSLLGSEWKVNILVHDQAMPMCDLVRALAGTGVLITPHGFQATNIVFLPYGAQFIEIIPRGYESRCFQKLGLALDHVGAWSLTSSLPKPYCHMFMRAPACREKLRSVDVQVDYNLLPWLLERVVASLEKNGRGETACLVWGGDGPRNLGSV